MTLVKQRRVNMAPSIGVNLRVTGHCNQGGRKYMEDAFAVAYQQTKDETDLEYAYFGIFDGHGGREAALFAKEHLMDYIVSQKGFWSDDDESVLKAIKDGFVATHMAMWKEVSKWPQTVSGLPSTSGSTASVVFIRKGKLYVGHVGDSAVVLGFKEPGEDRFRAVPLTRDHKPESPVEKRRIETMGGAVMSKSGVQRVVWNRPRLGHQGPIRRSTHIDQIPFLAVARSLGDLWSYDYFHGEFIVSPEPDVKVIRLDPKRDRCIVLASDGLWNMISASTAVLTVQEADRENERHILEDMNSGNSLKPWVNPSKRLVDKAIEYWYRRKMRADNTSVVTVMLDPPGPPRSEVLMRQHMLKKLRPREEPELGIQHHQESGDRRDSRILVASTPSYPGARSAHDKDSRQSGDMSRHHGRGTMHKASGASQRPQHVRNSNSYGNDVHRHTHIRILHEPLPPPSEVTSSSHSMLGANNVVKRDSTPNPLISSEAVPVPRGNSDLLPPCASNPASLSHPVHPQRPSVSAPVEPCEPVMKTNPAPSSHFVPTKQPVIAAADSTQPSFAEESKSAGSTKRNGDVITRQPQQPVGRENRMSDSSKPLQEGSQENAFHPQVARIHALHNLTRGNSFKPRLKSLQSFKANPDIQRNTSAKVCCTRDTPNNVPTSTTTDCYVDQPKMQGYSTSARNRSSHPCVRCVQQTTNISRCANMLLSLKRKRASLDSGLEPHRKRLYKRGHSWSEGYKSLRLLRHVTTRSKRQRKVCA